MKSLNEVLVFTFITVLLLLASCNQSETEGESVTGVQAAEVLTPPEVIVVQIPTHINTVNAIDAAVTTIVPSEHPPQSQIPVTEVVQEITVSPSPENLACTNAAELEKSLTISDGSLLKENNLYAKVWRVKNVGTCTWNTGYRLVFIDGDPSLNITGIQLPSSVQPGETIDLKVNFPTMDVSDTYKGNWLLESDNGIIFGIGPDADQPLVLSFVVKTKSKLPGVC